MRLLPFTLFHDDPVYMTQASCASALITHKHPENVAATNLYINAASAALKDQIFTRDADHIKELGEGWTAWECVEMAVYAAGKAKTFDELLEISIAHDGDSDSVGAIAGSLWGLAGKEVPKEYIDKLVEKDAIKYCIKNYIYKNNAII